jgi:hypothetical protein
MALGGGAICTAFPSGTASGLNLSKAAHRLHNHDPDRLTASEPHDGGGRLAIRHAHSIADLPSEVGAPAHDAVVLTSRAGVKTTRCDLLSGGEVGDKRRGAAIDEGAIAELPFLISAPT